MRRVGVIAGLVTFALAAGCGKPAQIGSDEEAHRAVDALFTALTARDPRLLDQCEKRLDELAVAGKLPADSHRAVGKIIGKARGGGWESAAERLHDFIAGQETGPARAAREPAAGRKKK